MMETLNLTADEKDLYEYYVENKDFDKIFYLGYLVGRAKFASESSQYLEKTIKSRKTTFDPNTNTVITQYGNSVN